MHTRRFTQRLLPLFAVLSLLFPWPDRGSVRAQAPPQEDRRIERLSGLCKLWGTIKYFHPSLAYRDIDWDLALVHAIPEVDAAQSSQEYRTAIAHLLTALHDPMTTTEQSAQTVPQALSAAPDGKPPLVSEPVEDAQVVHAEALLMQTFPSPQAEQEFLLGLEKDPKTPLRILDCRRIPNGTDPAQLIRLVRATALSGVPAPVPLGTWRHRSHSGYATQTGYSSGNYYSALVTETREAAISANPTGKFRPTAILVDATTPSELLPLLSGLQARGQGVVVAEERNAPEDGKTVEVPLPEGVTVTLRVGEFVNPDGGIGFHPDVAVPPGSAKSPPADPCLHAALEALRHPLSARPPSPEATTTTAIADRPYAEMRYPNREYRLLALFRYWNIIRYFFAYRDLMDEPWDEVLTRFIPRFETAKNATEYGLAVAELSTHLHDSHAFLSDFPRDLYVGYYGPLLLVSPVRGQTVVTKIVDADAAKTAGIQIGDVIQAVDGEPVAKRLERLGRFYAASTPQAQSVNLHHILLAGQPNTKAILQVVGRNGKTREVEMPRSANVYTLPLPKRETPVYGVLPSGFGYIDLDRLTWADSDKAMDAVQNTPGLIFDMRGYPNGTAWTISPRLASQRVKTVRFRTPTWDNPREELQVFFDQTTEPNGKPRYQGKVVMLIDASAGSQAEHTCLYFEAATHVTFIGTPTGGYDGDVTYFYLPGGIVASFSGHEVRHADGRQLQRIGIQPQVRVEPSVRGIREGRDEILEAAIRYLHKQAPH